METGDNSQCKQATQPIHNQVVADLQQDPGGNIKVMRQNFGKKPVLMIYSEKVF